MIKQPIHINTQTSFHDTLTNGTPIRWAAGELSEDDLLLEAATLEEIDLAYLGSEILFESTGAMFEAITTSRIKLSQTMRAFIRVLNRGLNGTDISAGTDEVGDDGTGRNSIGGAIVGKVRRVAGIPVMTAQIPLTDGQTTSIIFHSPTAEVGRVKGNDILVAFQFLLNKRDVTHVVAPIGGRDVSLNQVCQVLSNLIERNSGKFRKAKERQAQAKADIEAYLSEADKLIDERSVLIDQIEEAQSGLSEKRSSLADLQKKLDNQKAINAELVARRDGLKKNKETPELERPFNNQLRQIKSNLLVDGVFTLSNGATVKYVTVNEVSYVTIAGPDGNYSLQAKDMQGKSMADAATKLLKAYRENKASKYQVDALPGEPEPQPEPQPEPEGGDVSEADKEANKALEYVRSVPSQFNSRNLAEISAELDHVQEAANALIAAGRFDENEVVVGAAVDHLIAIMAELQQKGA